MKTVRFVRDTDSQREGGPGFKSGEVHSLNPRSAQRWVLRGAAVYEADAIAKLEHELEARTKAFEEDMSRAAGVLREALNGDAVVSSAGPVEGADGADPGERPEPDASTPDSAPSGSGRSGSGSGRKQHGRAGSKK